jgi:hypothetical protein
VVFISFALKMLKAMKRFVKRAVRPYIALEVNYIVAPSILQCRRSEVT